MSSAETSPRSPTRQFLAMLAGQFDSGIILCCGESLYDYCLDISRSMPMTTRLVVNVSTARGLDATKSLSSRDIRIAVHRQDFLSFLADISQYYFNLVLLDNHPDIQTMLGKLQDKLMPGGYFAILNADIEEIVTALPETHWHVVETCWPDKAVLCRLKSKDAQPTRRQGGRRAKILKNR